MTRTVLRHRAFVVAAWLALALAGTVAGTLLPQRLTALTSVPGSPSAAAESVLGSRFGDNSDGTFIVIVPFGQADPTRIEGMQAELSAAIRAVPDASLMEHRAIGGVLYGVIGTNLSLLDASNLTDTLRAALQDRGLTNAIVTGAPALEHDVRPVLAEDLQRGTAVAVVAALLLLVVVLGWARVVIVPLLIAGAVVAVSLLGVFVLNLFTPMVLYIPNIIELVGLGLAIDYSLLLVQRFRAEVASGSTMETAVTRTMARAGRTVVISGLTAAVGLCVLFLTPVPFVRSLGAAGVIVPLVSTLAALTLQPVLLAMLGHRGVSPRGWRGVLALRSSARRWTAVAQAVVRNPRTIALASLAALLVIAAPMASIRLAPASLAAVPPSLEAARGVSFLATHVGAGAATPHSVIVDTGARGAAVSAEGEASRVRLAAALTHVPGVFAVVSDTTTEFIDASQRYQRFIVLGRDGFAAPGTQAVIERLRHLDLRQYGYASRARAFVAGTSSRGIDFLDRIQRSVPWIVIVSLLVAYVVMSRAFRSRLLPAIAVSLNLISVAAALGVVAFVFHFILGHATIEAWALVFLFALLFGLSMDYQVFMLSRIREAAATGVSMREAIVQGVEQTASVITAAAAILVAALAGLIIGHITGLQELGVGLAAGVVIDATIVRTLLLPSVLAMLGDRAR